MTETVATFSPQWVSPPGDTIADLLDEYDWSQAELAVRTAFSTKHVNLLIKGTAPISEETALRLERTVGSTAQFWLNRECQYREALARRDDNQRLRKEVGWLKQIPVAHMVRYRWIQKKSNKIDQVAECLRFFGVSSVEVWSQQYGKTAIAFRRSPKHAKHAGPVGAWLRQGERRASEIRCEAFSKHKFRETLTHLRRLTNTKGPKAFMPALVKAGAAVGVAVVLEPAPPGCPVSGATRWLSPDKALLLLSLRHKTNDHFWFSFFHEAAHLLLHGKKLLFLELDSELGIEEEIEADQFAQDWLIPSNRARELASLPASPHAIRRFAATLGIAPGIVVGRMQRQGLVGWSRLNDLKTRYEWASDSRST